MDIGLFILPRVEKRQRTTVHDDSIGGFYTVFNAAKIGRHVGLSMKQNANYSVCVKLWLLIGHCCGACGMFALFSKSTMSSGIRDMEFSIEIYWLSWITITIPLLWANWHRWIISVCLFSRSMKSGQCICNKQRMQTICHMH